MKNKSLVFLFILFFYGIHFGVFPSSFPENTKCKKKEDLKHAWYWIKREIPRAIPIVTNKCLIRIANLQHLKATKEHFEIVLELQRKNKFYKPLPANKNKPEYLPDIWNDVV